MTKNEARKLAKEIRNGMNAEMADKCSETIQDTLLSMEEYRSADTIFLYKSVNNEVDTDKLIERAFKDGKKVALPKVVGSDIKFYRIESMEELVFGYMGIPEPEADPYKLIEDEEALLVLPGVAFDEKLNRVGYGGGFYDRFIDAHPDMVKIALAYEKQIMTGIEFDEHDRKADLIITEKKVYTPEN